GVSQQWQRVLVRFPASFSRKADNFRVSLHLGYCVQKIDIAELRLAKVLQIDANTGKSLVDGDIYSSFKLSDKSGNSTFEIVPAQNLPFPTILRLTSKAKYEHVWDAQLMAPVAQDIAAGDLVQVQFYIRATQ